MESLYSKFFAVNSLETVGFMWWDQLAYDYHPMKLRLPPRNEEDARVQEAMFETLSRILDLDSPDCQKAALHGLSHVQHPKTRQVIEGFLRKSSDLEEEIANYARYCIEERVL